MATTFNLLFSTFLFISTPAVAIEVVDDAGVTIALEHAAQRIVTLSPHATELVFAAGAGNALVATVTHSDYPVRARQIPRIGNATQLDRERILALRPDLVIAWYSGNRPQDLDWLNSLGIPIYHSEPARLEAIAENILEIGLICGTQQQAQNASNRFRNRLADLRRRWRNAAEKTVFYQLWPKPLITISKRHLITQVLALCHGENIFSHLTALTPHVTLEAVLLASPQAIIAANDPAEQHPFATWQLLGGKTTLANARWIQVPADLIHRPGPRLLDAAELICSQLQD